MSQFTHAQGNSSNYPWHEEGRGPDPMPSLSAAYPQDAHRADSRDARVSTLSCCAIAHRPRDHGVTGYIVHDETAAVAAASRLDRLSSNAIRDRFETRFTARRMAEDYVALYRRIAVRTRPALRVVT